MKKKHLLAIVALLMVFGCSKEEWTATETESAVSESGLIASRGKGGSKPGNGVNLISFESNSTGTADFVTGCLPEGRRLLREGNFSGSLSGFGKIKSGLSNYEIVSCDELPIDPPNVGEPHMYTIEVKGMLATGPNDYCSITVTGNIYPWYDPEIGYDSGLFMGQATTHSGAGKLKGLDNKSFSVHSGDGKGPTINLESGTIRLRYSDYGQ